MIELNKIYHADCLDLMREIPDKSIDLVLTDPPYGLGDRLSDGGGKLKNSNMSVLYRNSEWIDEAPPQEVFDELFRISKEQIIFGGNYFDLPPTRGIVVWDKLIYMPTLSHFELAWTSYDKPAKMYRMVSSAQNKFHPTQKPVKLFELILQDYSEEGQTILDPFSGSGTTAIACHNLNRNFICIEKDKDYHEKSVKRYEEHIKQERLFI